MNGLEAYHKIDHTICLNNIRKNIEFNIDKDGHIDCNNLNETIDCLEIIKKELEDFNWLKSKLNCQFVDTLSLEDKIKVLEILGVKVTY